MIGCEHGIFIVLDHDQRIAEVAQTFEGRQQLVIVALVQADGRLVQNIQHAHQRRTDLSGKTNTLALAARQRTGRARKRQIFQTDRLQETQSIHDFLDNAITDLVLHLGQLQGMQKLHRLDDRLFGKLRNVQPADRHRQHLRPQTATVTRRTGNFAHTFLDLAARVVARGFLVASLEIAHDALKRLAHHAARHAADRKFKWLIARAVQQLVHRRIAHLLDRRVEREAVLFAKRGEIHARDRARLSTAPARGTNRTLADGQLAVGQDAVGVDAHLHAQSRTHRTCTVRIVEREHARGQFFNGNTAVLTSIVLRESDRFAADHVRDHQAARQRRRRLDRVGQAAAHIRADGNAVDHDLNVVLFGLLQLDLFRQVAHFAIHPHADIALPTGVLEHLDMLALFAADDRRKNLHARFFFQRHQPVDDLVDRLLMNLLAALRAVRRADARP